jgi:hypothetical protein
VLTVLIDKHQLPVQRACRIVRLSRTAYYRSPPPQMRTDAPVIAALMAVLSLHYGGLRDRFRRRPANSRNPAQFMIQESVDPDTKLPGRYSFLSLPLRQRARIDLQHAREFLLAQALAFPTPGQSVAE